MDLICEKYKETFSPEDAVCAHLEEYCKFREACIINFTTRERQREERREQDSAGKGGAAGGEKQGDHG